jgi:DNA methylase
MPTEGNYEEFLLSKIKVADRGGFQCDRSFLHPSLRPDQADIVQWAVELGRALVAPDAGMGKTRIGIEVCRVIRSIAGGKALVVTELGAADTFVDQDPEIGEGAAMGLRIDYVTNQAEAIVSPCDIVVTNYERVRDGNFDFAAFSVVWLDEGNYVKNMASETTEVLKAELAKVKYKFIATATPSPNEQLELINYAHVLGICDRGQILTRFFQRNSVKAGELTLHPQHEQDFWLWVHSWCIAITSPKDLGYDYPGFELPKLNVHWIEVPIGKGINAGKEKDGQARLFIESRSGLSEAARIKRESIESRVYKALEIRSQKPDEHFILWHHLEDERKAIKNMMDFDGKKFGELYGSQAWEIRERNIIAFTKGELTDLSTKPSVSGVGCNFQKHCWNEIFVGITDSFNDIYQALKRVYRFYNPSNEVNVWLLYTPEEYDIVLNLKRKWAEHDLMRDKMREIIKTYGLNHSKYIEEKRRSFLTKRLVTTGQSFTHVNNDAVFELDNLADNSVQMGLSSFPFGNHYEYTDKYNDFGHNQTNQDFIKQLDFLIPKLLRVLAPGRIFAVHLKNRIHYGSVTGLGFSTLHRFTHLVCDAMEKNGFYTIGYHYIPTDVVAENNQTYRLGYTEMKKDSTKMGAGIPEEIWIFRKPPTSNSNAYADEPVKHDGPVKVFCCPTCGYKSDLENYRRVSPDEVIVEVGFDRFDSGSGQWVECPDCKNIVNAQLIQDGGYSLAHWQIDADAFWKSSGNRYLTPNEMMAWGLDKIQSWWKRFNKSTIYDYDQHVALLKELDEKDKLSRLFTTLPLQSTTDFILNDMNRMQGLNLEQSRRKLQNHICPMPFDEVDRMIEMYSNPGDLILDPFGGLATTGVRAIKKKRRAYIIELNETYSKSGVIYLKEAEYKNEIPTLFDMMTA